MRKLDEHCKSRRTLLSLCIGNSIRFSLYFKGKEYKDKENLKEMGDVSSGMASTVIQAYLKSVLDSFIHPSVMARHAALKVITLILAQGLVHPVQIVPYLICMSTDAEPKVRLFTVRLGREEKTNNAFSLVGFSHCRSRAARD
jgi:hypothetical protein